MESAVAKNLFTEQFRLAGKLDIAPGKFAAALQLQIQELAQLAGVHRATVREAPSNLRLQNFLRESLRVLAAAAEVSGNQEKAMFWFRNEPIREFGYQTAEKLVSAGKTDAVVDYLQSIESGSTG